MNNNLAIQKNLIINGDKTLYNTLENTYKYLFEAYMVSKLNIKLYDDKIRKSDLGFIIPIVTKDQLKSGLIEYLNTKYIYLINNFYIEKLDLIDIEKLNNFANGKENLNDELMNFVERTYKDVITKNFIDDRYVDYKFEICYGNAIPEEFASNDSIVFKIFYAKGPKILDGEEYAKNMLDQISFLDSVKLEMEKEISTKLNIPCKVLVQRVYQKNDLFR